MKAWKIDTAWGEGSTVVFAETRGKAHALAMRTDCCEDASWTDVRAVRLPEMDKMYRPGKWEMDWDDKRDRIALVKDCGWYCFDVDREYCEGCPASEWCGDYQDWKMEEE